jgi:hypothetical protein
MTTESIWKTHSYINEYIRFADQKAGALIGVGSAVIGAMVWADLPGKLKPPSSLLNQLLIALAFILLFVSFAYAWGAIYPRLFSLKSTAPETPDEPSPIFFEEIQAQSMGLYIEKATQMSEEAWGKAAAKHCWQLSKVANKKYSCIVLSARLWLVGTLLACIMVLVNR